MFGVKMRNKNETDLIEILQDKLLAGLQNERNQMRMQAKVQIGMAQENYKRNYDRRRRGHLGYQLSDLVAIKVTQFVNSSKLGSKYIGPYEVIKLKRNGKYDVRKVADFQGPIQTSTSADYMKLWRYFEEEDDDDPEDSSEADEEQDGRV